MAVRLRTRVVLSGTRPPFSRFSTRSQRRANAKIVRDENRGELMGAVQVFQQLKDHLAGPEIQVAGRLIGEQNTGLSHQSAGQHHPLLFSAR